MNASNFPGPDDLGRGLVIRQGQALEGAWQHTLRVRIGAATLEKPEAVVQRLHRAWLERERVVVELDVSADALREPQFSSTPVYELDPEFEFPRERLHFLVWANNYDGTRGDPVWWHGRLAQRLGAPEHPEADIDIDGPTWVDGGPRQHVPFPVVHRESVEQGRLVKTLPTGQAPLSLAPDQQAAVLHTGGAARILAPAGSGKTRVLTGRAAYLLSCGFEPERVTALAYNRRAAQEMQERLGARRPQVRTLHALGFSLLRRYRNVRLASESEIRSLLSGLVKTKPQLNQDPLAPYFEAFQMARMGLYDPEKIEAVNEEIPGFGAAFPRYRARLAELGWVDHDEQIYGAIELLISNPEARKTAQRACTHLLVDEFQDLTPAFLLLVRLLAAPSFQVFGVGDDDQVIYGYAGASPDFLIHFDEYFPGSKAYALEVNYRCPSGIVEAADNLLKRNKVRVKKLIRSPQEGPSKGHPELLMAPGNAWVSRAMPVLQGWVAEVGAGNIAVLARVNALLLPIQIGLRHLGIPYHGSVDSTILRRTGLRTALAYLRIVDNPKVIRPGDLAEALRRPNRKLRREVLEQAGRCKSRDDLRRLALKLDDWPASQIEEFLTDLELLGRRLERGLVDFFRSLRCETGFLQALDQLDAQGLGASSTSSHRDDLIALEQAAALFPGTGRVRASDFEEWLDLALTKPESPLAESEGMRLSTVHRVKGLEWDYVLIYGADSGLFPHQLCEDVEEERRVFHVALTRARRKCVMLADPSKPSPFLAEMQPPPQSDDAKKKKKKKKR